VTSLLDVFLNPSNTSLHGDAGGTYRFALSLSPQSPPQPGIQPETLIARRTRCSFGFRLTPPPWFLPICPLSLQHKNSYGFGFFDTPRPSLTFILPSSRFCRSGRPSFTPEGQRLSPSHAGFFQPSPRGEASPGEDSPLRGQFFDNMPSYCQIVLPSPIPDSPPGSERTSLRVVCTF